MNLERAVGVCCRECRAGQRHRRLPGLVTPDLDVAPADPPRAGEFLQRLVHRLLRGEARGDMGDRIVTALDVLALVYGEQPLEDLVPAALEHVANAVELDQVDADADDAHARAHHHSANGSSSEGNGRKPPSTRPT